MSKKYKGLEITEGQLKVQIEDYLQYQQNAGVLYWDRLNSGDFIEVRGDTRRRVRGCRKGTADLIILKGGRTLFIELKGRSGRLRPEQRLFGELVQSQGSFYGVVRSLEELMEVLSEEKLHKQSVQETGYRT
ncbi:hypothetical protein LCGC14_1786330 [marine sediment metagenome]|uniref:VRR-NUC domain-containing protein n=1 Tax=marine sediment metagenome TaxID=412755 RepID=A0A0F9GTY3_9ZZZZ